MALKSFYKLYPKKPLVLSLKLQEEHFFIPFFDN